MTRIGEAPGGAPHPGERVAADLAGARSDGVDVRHLGSVRDAARRVRRDLGDPGCLSTWLRRKIADGVAFLVSDYGSYLHGVVDCGVTA
jgi:hypothetical protein